MNQMPNQDHSQNLQNTNPEGYKHLILPGKSPILAIENSLVKIRKLIRVLHLDINIPIGILLLILLGSSMQMIKNKKSDYELVKDLGALTGVGWGILFAMSSLHGQYHYNKRGKASEYIEEWRSDKMVTLRRITKEIFKEAFFEEYPTPFNPNLFNKCHSILTELKKTPDGIEILEEAQSKILERLEKTGNEEEKHKVQSLLSFFEHMGQDVKSDVADSDYLKDYFYAIVISHYEFFRKYVEYEQYDTSCRLKYCNFVYMAQTWEKEGFLPELPKICNRPLVITSRDIKKIKKAKSLEEHISIIVVEVKEDASKEA